MDAQATENARLRQENAQLRREVEVLRLHIERSKMHERRRLHLCAIARGHGPPHDRTMVRLPPPDQQ